jgi:hypothetical protein
MANSALLAADIWPIVIPNTDKIANFLLVVFNGLLVIVTYKLVSSTNKLWSTATDQTRLAQRSIDLARSEFLATHRPRLKVRVGKLGGSNNAIIISYTVINVGETPAKMVLHKTKLITQAANGYVIPSDTYDEQCVRLIGGEAKTFPDTHVNPDFDTTFLAESGGTIIFRGAIEYVDDADIKRRTGFLRSYTTATGRFVADTDLNEEYED